MKTKIKKALIIATILSLAGLVVSSIALYMVDFDFERFSTDKMVESTYVFTEEINLFGITTETADVEIALYDGEGIKVVCRESKKEKHNVYVNDDVLYIEVVKPLKWDENIEITNIFSIKNTKVEIYLPKSEYVSMSIETDAGDVTVPDGLVLESLVVKTDTGDCDVRASARDVIWISTNTGDVWLENISAETLKVTTNTGIVNLVNAKLSETVILESDTGDIQLQNVRTISINAKSDTGDMVLSNIIITDATKIETNTGDVKFLNSIGGALDITTDTGDVTFSSSDATAITIVTSTGDVSGTLLTSKMFSVATDTGRVNIPKSITGGKCEITTDTGDINIAIGKQ